MARRRKGTAPDLSHLPAGLTTYSRQPPQRRQRRASQICRPQAGAYGLSHLYQKPLLKEMAPIHTFAPQPCKASKPLRPTTSISPLAPAHTYQISKPSWPPDACTCRSPHPGPRPPLVGWSQPTSMRRNVYVTAPCVTSSSVPPSYWQTVGTCASADR